MGKDVLDTDYLIQPRGPGKGYVFRMRTPDELIGRENPKTGRPYGREIRQGLGTRNLVEARNKRDILLGAIKAQVQKVRAEAEGDLELALSYAEELRQIEDPELHDVLEMDLSDRAEKLEEKVGLKRAKRWYDTATGKETPLKVIYGKYLGDAGKTLSKSTLINLETAWRDFQNFCGGDVTIESVERATVSEFVTEYLPRQTSPRSPNGPSPATITKKVTLMKGIWTWAMKRGYIPMEPMTPWDKQAPSKKAVRASSNERRPFRPEEVQKLFKAEAEGSVLGDVMRVALLTGARLSEIVELDAKWIEGGGAGYTIPRGKTENAVRFVPLVGPARAIIERRLKAAKEKGALFPELDTRKSDNKKSPAVSTAFTRLRRKVLGEHTDGELSQHSFRHTWRTVARRAGLEQRTINEMGGWSRGDSADVIYDHGLERERYHDAQESVLACMVRAGFLADENPC